MEIRSKVMEAQQCVTSVQDIKSVLFTHKRGYPGWPQACHACTQFNHAEQLHENHPEQYQLHHISIPLEQQSIVLAPVQNVSGGTMRECQVISTVSNGAYRSRDIASRTINTLFNRATQDDPRPALAVKKRIQCTAPTPWQLSTLTHLLTPNLQKQTGPHTQPTTRPHSLYKS